MVLSVIFTPVPASPVRRKGSTVRGNVVMQATALIPANLKQFAQLPDGWPEAYKTGPRRLHRPDSRRFPSEYEPEASFKPKKLVT